MAISLISAQNAKGTGTTSAAATYPGATTSGNLLVASTLGTSGTDTLAITGWTKGPHAEAGSNGVAIFYKLADGTESTVTVTGGSTVSRIHIYEYTGNANPIVVDQSNSGSNVASAGATGAGVTTTNARDLIFASVAVSNAVTSPAATAPFNTRQTDATGIRLFDGDQIVSATGTYTPAFTWTTSTASRNAVVAFKAAVVTLSGDASEAVTVGLTATGAPTGFGDANRSVTATLSAAGDVGKTADADLTVTAGLTAAGVVIRSGDAAITVTADPTGDVDRIAIEGGFLATTSTQSASATVVSGTRIGSNGTVKVSVLGVIVGTTGTVAVRVLGSIVGSTGLVAISVIEQRVGATGPVRISFYGSLIGSSGDLTVEVHRFLGTGVHRPRSRVWGDPVRMNAGPTVAPPPDDDPDDPPPDDPPPDDPPPDSPELYYQHPYWTVPLAVDEPLAPTSADFVARLAYQARMTRTSSPVYGNYNAPFNTAVNGGNAGASAFALPIYRMDLDAPRVPVRSKRWKSHLQAQLDLGVPVPDPTLLPDGTISPSGSDGAVIIMCGNEVWEFWQFRPRVSTDPVGYPWVCTQAGYIADKTTHPAIWRTLSQGGYGWGVAASGMSKLAGMLRAEDYYADAINHPLGLSLPLTGGSHAVTPNEPDRLLPATRFDRQSFVPGGRTGQYPAIDAKRVPEGARFRLPHTFDIDAYMASAPWNTLTISRAATLRKVLVCLRDHGLIITDSAGVVAFAAENPKTYGTPYNPFTLNQIPVWGNIGAQLPWESLVQIAHPTTMIAAVGP